MAALWPQGVVFKEERGPAGEVDLLGGERELVAKATARRRAQFAATRALARAALAELGVAPAPIGRGSCGQPLFPAGAVGTLTHRGPYRACAVAPASRYRALGVDAEPDRPPPPRAAARIAGAQELARLAALPAGPNYLTVLFCAKEALYKAACSLGGPPPPLEVAVELSGGPAGGFFRPVAFEGLHPALRSAWCRWQAREGILLAAVAVPRS